MGLGGTRGTGTSCVCWADLKISHVAGAVAGAIIMLTLMGRFGAAASLTKEAAFFLPFVRTSVSSRGSCAERRFAMEGLEFFFEEAESG